MLIIVAIVAVIPHSLVKFNCCRFKLYRDFITFLPGLCVVIHLVGGSFAKSEKRVSWGWQKKNSSASSYLVTILTTLAAVIKGVGSNTVWLQSAYHVHSNALYGGQDVQSACTHTCASIMLVIIRTELRSHTKLSNCCWWVLFDFNWVVAWNYVLKWS